MDKLVIEGGKPLNGTVKISGAKNAALPILCACLLTDEKITLHNVPDLHDIKTLIKVLQNIGVDIERNLANETLILHAKTIKNPVVNYDIVKTMRASILVLGPLLSRLGNAVVSLPGGCAIGARPVEQHIKGLRSMLANISIEHGDIHADTNEHKKLIGTKIVTDMITVTGTENLMMAACLAKGTTIIENAAREPEVVDLANMLIAMGANISGIGSDKIIIEGVEKLYGTEYSIMPDRIEAGTFLCAVAATGGNVTLTHCLPSSMDVVIDKLIESGLSINIDGTNIHASMSLEQTKLKPINIKTTEHPGFPTDMQAQFMVLNSIANGSSTVVETIFENRFMHVQELVRLGADIHVDGKVASINGVAKLQGATVMATDLRASACLVIGALVAQGTTVIERIYHLDRGYSHIESKIQGLGANIQRVNVPS
jgi:UDP-N-acetylglucosamine 1-carboxyvinyltransferase